MISDVASIVVVLTELTNQNTLCCSPNCTLADICLEKPCGVEK